MALEGPLVPPAVDGCCFVPSPGPGETVPAVPPESPQALVCPSSPGEPVWEAETPAAVVLALCSLPVARSSAGTAMPTSSTAAAAPTRAWRRRWRRSGMALRR